MDRLSDVRCQTSEPAGSVELEGFSTPLRYGRNDRGGENLSDCYPLSAFRGG